jgi:hypothetical protein
MTNEVRCPRGSNQSEARPQPKVYDVTLWPTVVECYPTVLLHLKGRPGRGRDESVVPKAGLASVSLGHTP